MLPTFSGCVRTCFLPSIKALGRCSMTLRSAACSTRPWWSCSANLAATPRVSRLTPDAVPGRDHWPRVFSAVFAGAGVVGGQVIGKSDRLGAYPVSRSFGPPDLAATIYSALGVDPATQLRDRLGRPLRLCSGESIAPLFTAAAM